MKSSLSLVLASLVLPSLLLVGCGGDDSSATNDLSAVGGDLSGVAKGDLAGGGACKKVATWPTDSVAAGAMENPALPYSAWPTGRYESLLVVPPDTMDHAYGLQGNGDDIHVTGKISQYLEHRSNAGV